MLKDKYEFSVDGLNAWLSDLKAIDQATQDSQKSILARQEQDFIQELREQSPLGLAYSIDVSRETNSILISQKGQDVIYSEFGTGFIGETNWRHPQEGEVNAPDGEPYETNKTRKDSLGWTFIGRDGEVHWTQGQIAGMQNYHAFQHVMLNMKKYVDGWLKGE